METFIVLNIVIYLFFAFLNDALHIFSLIVDGVNIGYILNTLFIVFIITIKGVFFYY